MWWEMYACGLTNNFTINQLIVIN